MKTFRLKREYYDVFDAGLASILFVILENVFLLLYSVLPVSVRSIAIVGMVASFGLELMFALAGYLTSTIRGVDFFKASKLNKKINGKVVWLTLLVALISVVGFSSFSSYFIMMLESFGYKSSLGGVQITSVFDYILYLFLVGVVPAVFEEICFRGTICAGLEKKNKHLAVWLSAFIFMIMHGGPEQTIHQFLLGVIFGYIFVYTQNLWVTILIHFFNNAIAVTMMFLEYLVANSNGLLGEITEEVTTVGFEGFSASEILTNVMTSLTTAVTAGALIYFIVKAIKKQLDKINEQKQELVSVDAGSASEQLTNSASFEKEQAEGENQTVVLVDGVVTSETKTETTITQYEQTKKKANIPAIVMMAASIGWLVFEWVMELISGFVG